MQTVVRFELLPKPTIYDQNRPRTGTNLPAVKTQVTRQNRLGPPLRADFAPRPETLRGYDTKIHVPVCHWDQQNQQLNIIYRNPQLAKEIRTIVESIQETHDELGKTSTEVKRSHRRSIAGNVKKPESRASLYPDAGIYLGGFDLGVSEHFADRLEGNAVILGDCGGEGVPGGMRREIFVYPNAFGDLLDLPALYR